jgi:osmotically-inducible protein OsmY
MGPPEEEIDMESSIFRPLMAVTAATVMAGSLLAGCQQRTTTVDTPNGSRTATTVEPAPAVKEAARDTKDAAKEAGRDTKEATAKAGDAIGDAAITAKVKTAFMADPDVKALQIDVDTKDGVVALKGSVDGRTNVDKAVQIARGIDGVKSVDNQLHTR